MKSIFCILALFISIIPSLRAEEIRDTCISKIIHEAIPQLTYVDGDKNWAGGFYNSNYVYLVIGGKNFGGPAVDMNTSFTIFRSKTSLSSAQIATRIRDFLVKRFHYPTKKPSNVWITDKPNTDVKTKLKRADFVKAFIQTYYPNNTLNDQGISIFIQVVRQNATDFGITVEYTTVKLGG